MAAIVAAAETPYTREPDATTPELLARAVRLALADAGLEPRDVDGLGVASFTLAPDHAVDLAWRLGLHVRWLQDDPNGGASALNLLQHARRAIDAGDASTIVLVAGDALGDASFRDLVDAYNVATRDHLAPLPFGGPNGLFALLTQRHMAAHGLTREDYGRVVVAQRAHGARNPNAVRSRPLSLEEYLAEPPLAEPLTRFDCVPVVSGADAVVVTGSDTGVSVRALAASYVPDDQSGDGLVTGLAEAAPRLWAEAGVAPGDVDVVSVYDDYPAMVLVQLADLGLAPDGVRALVERIASGAIRVNTSGGQLAAGQAGAAGGMHGLVEVSRRLLAGEGRIGLVSGYGMVLYRYGGCANAAVLERRP